MRARGDDAAASQSLAIVVMVGLGAVLAGIVYTWYTTQPEASCGCALKVARLGSATDGDEYYLSVANVTNGLAYEDVEVRSGARSFSFARGALPSDNEWAVTREGERVALEDAIRAGDVLEIDGADTLPSVSFVHKESKSVITLVPLG